jgi:hypothetical protein
MKNLFILILLILITTCIAKEVVDVSNVSIKDIALNWFDIQSHNQDQKYGPYRLDNLEQCQYYQQGMSIDVFKYQKEHTFVVKEFWDSGFMSKPKGERTPSENDFWEKIYGAE